MESLKPSIGFPLIALNCKRLTEASWNMRSTTSGIFVSLLWPSYPSSGVVAAKHSLGVSRSQKRLRRQKIKIAAGQESSSNSNLLL